MKIISSQSLIYKQECYEIIGICMEVHNVLGCGFAEAVYQEALSIEFTGRNIPFEENKILPVTYKGITLKKKYVADFVCFDKIILEIKAASELHQDHFSQVLNYLNATGFKLGLLVNFGNKSLQYKRIIL